MRFFAEHAPGGHNHRERRTNEDFAIWNDGIKPGVATFLTASFFTATYNLSGAAKSADSVIQSAGAGFVAYIIGILGIVSAGGLVVGLIESRGGVQHKLKTIAAAAVATPLFWNFAAAADSRHAQEYHQTENVLSTRVQIHRDVSGKVLISIPNSELS